MELDENHPPGKNRDEVVDSSLLRAEGSGESVSLEYSSRGTKRGTTGLIDTVSMRFGMSKLYAYLAFGSGALSGWVSSAEGKM